MTALASTDVTVTVNSRDKDIGHGALSKFMGVASIAFGDAALTYPTGGVPLPAIGRFGLQRQVDIGIVEPPSGDGYVYKYDRANHKVLIYTSAGLTPAGSIASAFTGSALAGHAHDLTDGSRIYTWSPGGGDIKGATEPAGTEAAADEAAGPVNAALIGAEQTFTAMAGTKSIALSPDVPRNVIIVVHNDSGGALDLYEGDTVYTITGTFRGAAQEETLTWTSTAGNKSVANTKFRYLAGVEPFDTVTGITYTNGAAGNLKASVAPGSLLGYPVDSDTGAEADFTKLTVDAADVTISSIVNVTNKTIAVGTTADGADVEVQYVVDFDQGATSSVSGGTPAGSIVSTLTGSAVAAAALAELANTAAPAATTLKMLFVGE